MRDTLENFLPATTNGPSSQHAPHPRTAAAEAAMPTIVNADSVAQPTTATAETCTASVHGPALEEDPADQLYDDWGGALSFNRPLSEAVEEDVDLSADDRLRGDSSHGPRKAAVLEAVLRPIDENEAAGLHAEGPQDDGVHGLDAEGVRDMMTEGPHYMDVHQTESQRDHWPWKDRKHCTLDTLGAFPRSLFSESELEGVRWFANANGVRDLPSVKSVKRGRTGVTDVAGSHPQLFTSSMNNMFVMADLATILRHEFANPLVAQHLAALPEDAGEKLSECSQGHRWRFEVDANLACPMVRALDGKDYYVNELAMVAVGVGQRLVPAIPRRWYRKDGEVWATVSPMLRGEPLDSLVVDEREGSTFELPLVSFRLSVEELLSVHTQAELGAEALPSPLNIAGVLFDDEKPLRSWEHPTRNGWRTTATTPTERLRVVGCPLWLYCDDTSGNTSKKWNKHNSLLFTLAGLPRSLVHLMYNIHYLATSNIASPLEMMEQLVEQLCAARKTGIRVWDAAANEYVLVVPWILAFLGDNPMSSEFASHIGMQGKCFCRCCKVKGGDGSSRAPGAEGDKARLDEFLSVGAKRTKEETVCDLQSQLDRALGGAPSGVDELATQTGTKDKYFTYYVGKLQETVNAVRQQQKNSAAPPGLTKAEEIRRTLQEVRASMPQDIFNPALRIPEFDPNRDTPFEALHVVLLGAVKYFWRDAVSRQTAEGKQILKTRLDSIDTAGLGIPRLRGHTLVQYAGSLVGRDFRSILQVAPVVLYGLLPAEAYEAWLALCRLAPIIFQPEIPDRTEYLKRLNDAVEDFLAATALWSTQWFNKPKFHLFVHLAFYVDRFGPPILYATEGFESYNFLIRLRSVHSNRHAPSADIGEAFSFLHAVRHLSSGGFVETMDTASGRASLRQAGEGVTMLVHDEVFRHLMGMDGVLDMKRINVAPILSKEPSVVFADTQTAQAGFSTMTIASSSIVLQGEAVTLTNGDIAWRGGWVLYRELPRQGGQANPRVGQPPSAARCARVEEILLRASDGALLGILLLPAAVSDVLEQPYRMPEVHVTAPHERVFVSLQDVALIQERQVTDEKTYEIVHRHPEERVLNISQLTNAALLAKAYVAGNRYPGLDRTTMIDLAIANRARLDADAERKKLEQLQRKVKRDAAKRTKRKGPTERTGATTLARATERDAGSIIVASQQPMSVERPELCSALHVVFLTSLPRLASPNELSSLESLMSQPPPSQPPPVTPGPIRVHRPRESPRFSPYELPIAAVREARENERNENRAPPSWAYEGQVPTLGLTHPHGTATALRRHASTSALTESRAGNEWSSFAPPAGMSNSVLAVDPLAKVHQLVRGLQLGRFQAEAYEFSNASESERALLQFGQILKLRDDVETNTLAVQETQQMLVDLKKYVSGNWALSKAQEELLGGLLAHWLVKPLKTYEKIYLRVGRYVHLRAEWLHLGVYVTDPLARQTIDKYLQRVMGQMKGSFRKEIVASIKERKPLDIFARTMLQKYHAPVVPLDPPQDTMAALALLRNVAAEIEDGGRQNAVLPGPSEATAQPEDTAGGETSQAETEKPADREKRYWPTVESRLEKLYKEYGEDREKAASGSAWKVWEKTIIDEDKAKYTGSRRRGRALTAYAGVGGAALAEAAPLDGPPPISFAEDMEREGMPADPQGDGHGPTLNLYLASALPVNFPPETMDGDVNMGRLGDVARTLNESL
ncbi:hypothetical protein OH77DRAFT_1522874 [Trametes cingulata]|nr:hypothetical protein OH77DRAFT_1522874 [Trametes cingulata]